MSTDRDPISSTEYARGWPHIARKSVSTLIIILGVSWVIYLLVRDLPSLRENFRIESRLWLAYTFVAGVAALLVTVPIFQMILRVYGGVPVTYSYAARLLFVAQILRHLPGRIWGVVYLVKETRQQIPAAAMLRANLDVMIYSLSFSLLVSATLTLWVLISGLAAGIAATIGVLVALVAIRSDWTGSIVRVLIRLSPANSAKWESALSPREPMSWSASLGAVTCYVVVWSLYLSVWAAFPKIFPGLADANIWLICASYSAAWVVGYITMITPGGLGIREAGFITLSTKLATLPVLTFLAVFIRLWQILIEIIVFIAFAFVKADPTSNQIIARKEVT